MLPNAEHPPAELGEMSVRGPVTAYVVLQLGRPPVRVRCRKGLVLRTPMPEAPIDKDRQALGNEREVSASTRQAWERPVYAVTETSPMEQPA